MAAAALPLAVSLRPSMAFGQAAPALPRGVSDVYVAESVPVDVTAGSVGEARERGLTQGRIAAYRRILERIVAREDLPNVPQQNAEQIIEMVREFSIANERSSAVRYLAELTVRFNPNAIRQLLRGAGIPFTETVSRPLVVVPVMNTGGSASLWGSVWHDTWARSEADGGLLPLIVPPNGAEETALVTAAQASSLDTGALLALADRYKAAGVLVVSATVEGNGPVGMTLTEIRSDAEPVEFSITHSGSGGQAAPEVLAGAVQTAVTAAADSWRRRNRVSFGVKNQMTALVPVTDLKDWLSIRGRLANVALVDQVDVQAMTRDRVQVTIHFAGEEEQLRLAMGQHNLSFTQQNGVWVLENIGAARRALKQPGAPSEDPPK
ncbi:MAG: DUF2066 domain-containing protein [Rhodospirillaceae bacterium]